LHYYQQWQAYFEILQRKEKREWAFSDLISSSTNRTQKTLVDVPASYSTSDHGEEFAVDTLLHKAIEHNQVILLVADLMKQKAWEDSRNYTSVVKDLECIISHTRDSSILLQEARKKSK
jgi:hypothetical protein